MLFNREGDGLAAKLRPGNVHSADDWEELLPPGIERQQNLGQEVVFRAIAAFAKPEIYPALEQRGAKYAVRVSSNDNLGNLWRGRLGVPLPAASRPKRKFWIRRFETELLTQPGNLA